MPRKFGRVGPFLVGEREFERRMLARKPCFIKRFAFSPLPPLSRNILSKSRHRYIVPTIHKNNSIASGISPLSVSKEAKARGARIVNYRVRWFAGIAPRASNGFPRIPISCNFHLVATLRSHCTSVNIRINVEALHASVAVLIVVDWRILCNVVAPQLKCVSHAVYSRSK